jgi:hypothetical protein
MPLYLNIMTSEIDYSSYTDFISNICNKNDLTYFKSDPRYTPILEHVSSKAGSEYLFYIIQHTNFTENEISDFCKLNDSIGNPSMTQYNFVKTSPTSLRYIFHAYLILKYLQSLNLPIVDIAEIGGGYGGLCLAIHHFANKFNLKINSYSIIDLPSACNLQKLYVSKVNIPLTIEYIDANTFGSSISKKNMFLISNYCFSEITDIYQKKYIQYLFPKVTHGFMVWNHIPVYNFGFTTTVEDEYPNTGGQNKYIYF